MAVITLIGVKNPDSPAIPNNYKLANQYTTDQFNIEFGGTWASQQKTLYRRYCGSEPPKNAGDHIIKEWENGATVVLKIVCKV